MTSTYWIEYQHTTGNWVVFEVNADGCTPVAAAATPEAAAAEMDLIVAINGACRVVQNGMTTIDEAMANYTMTLSPINAH